MAKTNASTLRKVVEQKARKPRPLTTAEKRAILIKKISSITALIVVGGLIGATVGISKERDRNMENYSTQSYEAGITDAQKVWFASIVKANEKNRTNLTTVSLPIDGKVERINGELYCKSSITEDGYYTFGNPEEFKCKHVISRAQEFNVGELEKIIPEGGSIEKANKDEYTCSTGEYTDIQTSLSDCVALLRDKMHTDYNAFVKDNYEEDKVGGLLVGHPIEFVEAKKETEPVTQGGSSSGTAAIGGTLSGGAGDFGGLTPPSSLPTPGPATIPPVEPNPTSIEVSEGKGSWG